VIYGKGFGVGVAFLDEAGQTLKSIEHLDMHTKSITGTTDHHPSHTQPMQGLTGAPCGGNVVARRDHLAQRCVDDVQHRRIHQELAGV
jgi:hypothetical protein